MISSIRPDQIEVILMVQSIMGSKEATADWLNKYNPYLKTIPLEMINSVRGSLMLRDHIYYLLDNGKDFPHETSEGAKKEEQRRLFRNENVEGTEGGSAGKRH